MLQCRWLQCLRLLFVAATTMLAACSGITVDPEPDDGGGNGTALLPTLAIALAGPDLNVLEGALVQLDGHASRSLTDEGATLSWSQIDGPQVLLTNPAGAAPAFIAPLAPAVLTFRLRVQTSDVVVADEISVRVSESTGTLPVYAAVPPDATGVPGRSESFSISQHGDSDAEVTWSARALCEGDTTAVVTGTLVDITLPAILPCAIRIDGVTTDGRRAGPAVRVYWPEETIRPSATRLTSSAFAVEPGEIAEIGFELEASTQESLALWDASGEARAFLATQDLPSLTFGAPAQKGRLLLAGWRRRGAVSGGVDYLVLDVTEGRGGNRAPQISSGPDRVTVPGGLFSLLPTAFDVDGDDVTVSMMQVLGPAATPDQLTPGLYQAPPDEGTLLFHLQAFDGIVASDVVTVRVVVDDDSTNQPPLLELASPRYVAPGQPFTLDASNASDDSGYIERWTLVQDASDTAIIVPEPIEATTREAAAFMLTAGADGDLYRLQVTAFDAEGASMAAAVDVIVEEAGPWIDPLRGDDLTGNGTLSAPFASLQSALPVAIRHRLSNLRLTALDHFPFGGELPSGLSLIGGFVWNGSSYDAGGAGARLPIADGGLVISSGGLADLDVSLNTPGAAVTFRGGCGPQFNLPCLVSDVNFSASDVHDGPLLVVDDEALLSIVNSTLEGGSATALEQSVIEVRTGAQARLEDTSVSGGSGDTRRGILCTSASLDVIGGSVAGGNAVRVGIGIEGTGCDIKIVAATISGGSVSEEGSALRIDTSSLRVEADATLIGATGGPLALAVGARIGAGAGPVEVLGTVRATSENVISDEAYGLILQTDRVELEGTTVVAIGETLAVAVAIEASEAQLRNLTLTSTSSAGLATGVTLSGANNTLLRGGILAVDGVAASGVELQSLVIDGLVVEDLLASVVGTDSAIGISLGASTGVVVRDSTWEVSAGLDVTPARGITLGSGIVEDSVVRVVGPGTVLGIVVAQANDGAVINRSALIANSTGADATALRAAAPVNLSSTFLRALGVTSAQALEARAQSTLRHVTVFSTEIGIELASASASLDIANSLVIAPTGILSSAGAGSLTAANACAFDVLVAYDDGQQSIVTELDLVALPCPACLLTSTEGVIDENGRLLLAAPDLIDRGIAAYADAFDIDGDARPVGAGADIGCDEFVPPND